MQNYLILLFLFFGLNSIFAQEQAKTISKDTLTATEIDPLTPAKAAFLSAIVPGLGQVYNNKYWKVPLVYGAIGTSTYLYLENQKNYHLYRDEYKSRLEGVPGKNPSLAEINENTLIRIQKGFQRNRDLSALFMAGFYILNIIDANIDAALSQFNVDEKLAFKPAFIKNEITSNTNFGFALNYTF